MLKQGIYEHIINQETERKIQEAEQSGLVCVQQQIDSAESPQMLANYLANAIRQKLEDTEEQQDRVNLINRIMIDAGLLDDKQIVKPADLLAEVITKQQSALQNQSNTQTIRPISGFRVSNLFTGGSSALSLGEEIRREIASADEICLIVSFLRLSGVRIIIDDLRKFCEREGSRLRIITTTYCGVTESKAIKELASLPNTEIKISYDTDYPFAIGNDGKGVYNNISHIYQQQNNHEKALQNLKTALDLVKDMDFDVVAGAESRGFIFGTAIAYNMHKPFILVRKKGKLPCETVEIEYDLEYGSAVIEMHKDSIKPGQKVVIIDDLMATGGTIEAIVKLVERLGGEVVKTVFLMELEGLEGRKKLEGYDVETVIAYPGK